MSPARRRTPATRVALRAVSGVAVVGALAAVATVGHAGVERWTGAEAVALDAGTRQVAVDPAPVSLVCPPPAALPDGADVGDDQFAATPVATTTTVRATVLGPGDDPALTALDGGAAAPLAAGTDAAVGTSGDGGRVLTVDPAPDERLRAAASAASVTTAGDLRGLAAASCGAPATDRWLVGGDSATGSSALLAVQNPSAGAASVHLEVFGPQGPVPVGGSATLTLEPGAESVVRLDSLAPEQERLAVHVQATGARVTASLQTQGIDGLVPAGTDVVSAGAAPGTTAVVTGVVSRGEEPGDPRAAELWLLAPAEGGRADVHVYGPDGRVTLRGAESTDLVAGAVTAVPLGGLAAGTYAVVVDAEVPVVAAAHAAVPGTLGEDAVVDGTPYDVAWSPGLGVPATDAAATGQVALPDGTAATVVLAGVPATRGDATPAGEVEVTVRGFDAAGAVAGEQQVSVPVGGTVEVPAADLGAVAAVAVDAPASDAGSVTWSVRLTASDGTGTPGTLVATLQPTSSGGVAGEVAVRRVDVP
ncbi:DUF5719 family protein [Isoptericola dokdonensis]|uniref:Large extracellular alpha-helical protein n=1 Tax=Isoptericola dokdonensis DS-3 TaxID=1300344 RepID=A0A168G039_9MICO|nr:DUF5719 family protein [Isoptericola dokdonensis]ANC32826.1 hypothetical protein I598_3317 [Isoptericola dokdonensis DS-3]